MPAVRSGSPSPPEAPSLPRRLLRFARHHRWSLSLSTLSGLMFVALAREVRDARLNGFDAGAAQLVTRARGELDGVMYGLTTFGDWRTMTAVTVGAVVALVAARRLRVASFLAISAIGGPILNTALKLVFQRARPEVAYFISAPSSFSFPSGHAMGSMCVLASLVVVVRVLRVRRSVFYIACVTAASLSVGVAASRVYFGVHFPSDVVGGQLAAAAWVSAITGWFYPRLLPGEQTEVPANVPSEPSEPIPPLTP